MTTNTTGLTPLTDALAAQGEIAPGTEGWWKVYGAHARDIRPGDLLLLKWDQTFYEWEIAEQLDAEVMAPKFRSTTGETFRVGCFQPIVVLRRGTHATLAGSL